MDDIVHKIEDIVAHYNELTPTTKIAVSYLLEAASLMGGPRQATYGDIVDNCKDVGDYLEGPHNTSKSALLHYIKVMQGFKQARIKHTPEHHDSRVDSVAYWALTQAMEVRLYNGDA